LSLALANFVRAALEPGGTEATHVSRHAPSVVQRFFDDPYTEALGHLKRVAKPGSVVVDLGCGRGPAMNELADLGMRPIGIDIYEGALAIARAERDEDWLVQGNIETIPLSDSSTDAVFSRSVLQYTDWRRVMQECWRILRPGGRVAFIEHLADNPVASTYRVLHRTFGWQYPPFQTPRAHMEWSQRDYFGQVFEGATFKVYHLSTPLALVFPTLRSRFLGTPLPRQPGFVYRFLTRIDRGLLGRFPSLSRFGWFMLMLGTKHG